MRDSPTLEVEEFQEFQGLLATPLTPEADGFVRVPEGPGLTVELNERWRTTD